MDHAIYHSLKQQIKDLADQLHRHHEDDKPLIRMELNDRLDSIIRNELQQHELNETLTKERVALYTEWLTNYVILRHES